MRLAVDAEDFLARYWQRRPLFLPAGLPGFRPPADADELAGLALEPGVDARIVRGSDAADWSTRRAPLEVADLQRPGPFTLLVQAVDHYWEEAATLLDALPFLPRWRLADVLMSYASDGGSAGPHFDRYDVFIVGGEGERCWQLGQRCTAQTPLRPVPGLGLLADFRPEAEYRLRCGDVLYIPPGVAHCGVSRGDSTSFSIGLRAPRLADLLARCTDVTLDGLDDDALLADAARPAAPRPGEFTAGDVARARAQLQALLDRAHPRWFGEVLTQAAEDEDAPVAALPGAGPLALRLVPGRRLTWMDRGAQLLVCAAGDSCHCPPQLAPALQQLCSGAALPLPAGHLDAPLRRLLQWLLDRATLHIDDDD